MCMACLPDIFSLRPLLSRLVLCAAGETEILYYFTETTLPSPFYLLLSFFVHMMRRHGELTSLVPTNTITRTKYAARLLLTYVLSP